MAKIETKAEFIERIDKEQADRQKYLSDLMADGGKGAEYKDIIKLIKKAEVTTYPDYKSKRITSSFSADDQPLNADVVKKAEAELDKERSEEVKRAVVAEYVDNDMDGVKKERVESAFRLSAPSFVDKSGNAIHEWAYKKGDDGKEELDWAKIGGGGLLALLALMFSWEGLGGLGAILLAGLAFVAGGYAAEAIEEKYSGGKNSPSKGKEPSQEQGKGKEQAQAKEKESEMEAGFSKIPLTADEMGVDKIYDGKLYHLKGTLDASGKLTIKEGYLDGSDINAKNDRIANGEEVTIDNATSLGTNFSIPKTTSEQLKTNLTNSNQL